MQMISEAEPIGVRSRHCGSSYIVCFFVCFNKKNVKTRATKLFLYLLFIYGGSYRHFCYIGIHTLIAAGLKTLLSCVHVRFQAVHVFLFSASGHLNWTSDMSVTCEVLGYLKVVKMKRTPSVPSRRNNWGLSQKWQIWSTLRQRLEIVWRLMAHSEQRRYSGFLSMVKRNTWEK